jgi:hypothetical protein
MSNEWFGKQCNTANGPSDGVPIGLCDKKEPFKEPSNVFCPKKIAFKIGIM